MKFILLALTAVSATQFTAKLGAKNGICGDTWDFRIVETDVRDGKHYGVTQLAECRKYHMLPICDHIIVHRDAADVCHFLGNDNYISTAWRSPEDGPPGFDAIKDHFKNICYYSAISGREDNVRCSQGTLGVLQTNAQNPKFMCARPHVKLDDTPDFTQELGALNGVCSHTWEFKKAKICDEAGGYYQGHFIRECAKYNMRPVCSNRWACRNDGRSVYLGQKHKLSEETGRNTDTPSGFDSIKDKFAGLCYYVGAENNHSSDCDKGKDQWGNDKTFAQPPEGEIKEFMCARVKQTKSAIDFVGNLGSFGGMVAAEYQFAKTVLPCQIEGGHYGNSMINECMTYGMQPICDYHEHCKFDSESVYIGHLTNLAGPWARDQLQMFPSGWEEIKDNWDGYCTYLGNEFRKKLQSEEAFCDTYTEHHSPSYIKPGAGNKWDKFMCGRVVVPDDNRTLAPTPTERPTPEPTHEPTHTQPPTEEPTAAPTDEPTDKPTAEPTAEPTAAPTGICEHLGGWSKKCKRISQNGGDWKPICKSNDPPACGNCKAKRRKCKIKTKCKKNRNETKCNGAKLCFWTGTKCKENKAD